MTESRHGKHIHACLNALVAGDYRATRELADIPTGNLVFDTIHRNADHVRYWNAADRETRTLPLAPSPLPGRILCANGTLYRVETDAAANVYAYDIPSDVLVAETREPALAFQWRNDLYVLTARHLTSRSRGVLVNAPAGRAFNPHHVTENVLPNGDGLLVVASRQDSSVDELVSLDGKVVGQVKDQLIVVDGTRFTWDRKVLRDATGDVIYTHHPRLGDERRWISCFPIGSHLYVSALENPTAHTCREIALPIPYGQPLAVSAPFALDVTRNGTIFLPQRYRTNWPEHVYTRGVVGMSIATLAEDLIPGFHAHDYCVASTDDLARPTS